MTLWTVTTPYRFTLCTLLIIVASATMSCGPSNHAIRPEKIKPDPLSHLHRHDGRVVLNVEGGWEEAILGLQLMPNDAVMEALKAAVTEAQLFRTIATDGQGDYLLSAFIFDIDQPLMGATGTVTLEMAWSLTEMKTEAVLWRESIETTHITPPEAAFTLRKKSNMAAEAATKKNIRLALERISNLQL